MTGAFKTKQDKGNRMLEEVFMLTPVYPFLLLYCRRQTFNCLLNPFVRRSWDGKTRGFNYARPGATSTELLSQAKRYKHSTKFKEQFCFN
jgi:hypothetical protein